MKILKRFFKKYFQKNPSREFWHFVPNAPKKKKNQFYELILHESKSIKLAKKLVNFLKGIP